MSRPLAAVAASLLLAGCPPFIWPDDHFDDSAAPIENAEDTGPYYDTDRPDDTEPGGEDTDVQIEYPEPYGMLLLAEAAWDPAEGMFTSWVIPDGAGTRADPYVRVVLFSEAPDPSELCQFTVEFPPLPAVDGDGNPDHTGGLGDPAVHLGVQFWPNEGQIVMNTCRDVLDPRVWGEDRYELLDRLSTVKWGLGITGALGEAEAQTVQQIAADRGESYATDYEPWVVGARLWLENSGTVHQDGTEFWFARAVATEASEGGPRMSFDDLDADGVRDPDEPWAWIPRDDIMTTTPPAGLYVIEPVYLMSSGVPLREVLFGEGAR